MKSVYVWDKFVRFFHWSLVLLFCVSYGTGDEIESVHVISGYAITTLIILRIIWGLVGSQYARFTNFVYAPTTVVNYLKSIFHNKPKRYIGHNPAGGAMIVCLLIALTMTTLSGMKLLAIEEGEGPFIWFAQEQTYQTKNEDDHHHDEDEEEEEFWEEIHEFFVNLMVLLIVLHIVGVLVSSKQHHEQLVKSMINGYKKSDGTG